MVATTNRSGLSLAARAGEVLPALRGIAEEQGGVVLRSQCAQHGLVPRQVRVLAARGVVKAQCGALVLRECVPHWVLERPLQFQRSWLDAWAVTVRARVRGVPVIVTGAAAAVLQGCFGDWSGRWQGARDLDGDWPTAHQAAQPMAYAPSDVNLRLHGVHIMRAGFDGCLTLFNGLQLADRATALLDTLDHASSADASEQIPAEREYPAALLDLLLQRKWLTPQEVIERRQRRRAAGRGGRRGSACLTWAARRAAEGTHSKAERRFASLLREHGLRKGGKNGWVANYEVQGVGRGGASWAHRFDVAWPSRNVAVEVDGRGYHSDEGAFERDRRVLGLATAAGWRILHVTWRQMKESPSSVIAVVRDALSLEPL